MKSLTRLAATVYGTASAFIERQHASLGGGDILAKTAN
jgi:uncharacterized membrane-anchored protein YitT (DUF2179 family)